MPESNNGLTFAQEIFLATRRDGKLVAIESQNGHITRYTTKEATKADTLEVFGLNKVQSS